MGNFISIRSFWIVAFGLNSLFGQCWCDGSIAVSHTAGKGLGYSTGYTSLDLFLRMPIVHQDLISFADCRGHVFNNGMHAANVGLGFRHINTCYEMIYGFNVVYDYLKNSQASYNQVGMGFEILGGAWDFCCNAYIPVGHVRKNIYRFNYAFYEQLKNEEATDLTFGLKAREQLALKGVDTLFGYRFCKMGLADLHVRGGPYCYFGRSAKTKNAFNSKHEFAVGGRFLVDVLFKDYFVLTGTTTYDHLFKWCGQVTLAINIPFDVFSQKQQVECPSYTLNNRLYERLERNEIITIDHLTRFTNNPNVLDP